MDGLKPYQRIHFVGIGGIGMSSIAFALLHKGFQVSGSDISTTPITQKLERAGARIHLGHAGENIQGADLVVTSSAIRGSNPEFLAARAQEIPIWRRAKILSEIMSGGRSVAIAGTHGKTTTTAMIGLALAESAFDPTVIIGAEFEAFGGNARMGAGEWVVAEADESDGSFLDYAPDRIIVTNIEEDHMDFYRDMDHILQTFREFTARIRPGGKAIVCADNPGARRLLAAGGFEALTYGVDNPDADLVARNIRFLDSKGGFRFTPVLRGKPLGSVRMRVPGRQNVSNALATILLGLDIGCPFESVALALSEYVGAKRRYQIKGASQGITVIDDYAHHPTEIKATLSAARSAVKGKKGRRIVGVFQPHRYSRTASLAEEFGKSFREADIVVLTDVYAAGEDPIDGVSGGSIFNHLVADGHKQAFYVPQVKDVAEFLRPKLNSGDLLFTLGAGDVWRLGERILDDLRAETPPLPPVMSAPAIAQPIAVAG